jgi:hypothetical protein
VSDMALAPIWGIGAVVLAGLGLICLLLAIATGRWPVWLASYLFLLFALALALLGGTAGAQPAGEWGVSEHAGPWAAVAAALDPMRAPAPDPKGGK